ncbi:lactate utilization protein C [candidate division KSB1 bacterium]
MTEPDSTGPRDRILDGIRSALRTSIVPGNQETAPDSAAEEAAINREIILSRFTEELDLLGVDCFRESTPEEVARRVGLLIGGRKIFCWDSASLPYGIASVLRDEQVVTDRDNHGSQAEAEIGLTGCSAGIAETGSLMLIPGEGTSGKNSLLPEIHVAVVKESDIYYSMKEVFDHFKQELRKAPYVNIITGPSRTADIEQTLTLGVHGPGSVIVVIGP